MGYCEKAENIKLLVIDTQGMPQGAFVKDTEIMSVFVPHEKHVPSEGWSLRQLYTIRKNKYRFGEYLSQGKIDIRDKSDEASFCTMMGSGLGFLYPWLFDHSLNGKWAKRVLQARYKYHETPNLPAGCVQKAIGVAQKSFGEFRAVRVAVRLAVILGNYNSLQADSTCPGGASDLSKNPQRLKTNCPSYLTQALFEDSILHPPEKVTFTNFSPL